MQRKKQRIFGMTGCQISILSGLAIVSCLSVVILAFLLYSSQVSTLMVSELPTAILLPTSTYLPISTRTPFFTSTPEPTETKIPTPTETIHTKNAKDYIPSIDDIPSGFVIYPANSGIFTPSEITAGWKESYKISYVNSGTQASGVDNYIIHINIFNNPQNAGLHYEHWTTNYKNLGTKSLQLDKIGNPNITGLDDASLFMGADLEASPLPVATVLVLFRIGNITGAVNVNDEITSANEMDAIFDNEMNDAYYLLGLIVDKTR